MANLFYGTSSRKTVSVLTHFYSENAPLSLYPDILDHVLEYIHIPNDVVKAYRALAG